MDNFEQAIQTATAKLKGDPDIQLEVSHELRTHLEASTAEHLAAGQTPDQAAHHALQDLGDPQSLSNDLFAANRNRLRMRTVARVMGGAIALPAAVGLSVWSLMGILAAGVVWLAVVLQYTRPLHTPGSWWTTQVTQIALGEISKRLNKLPDESRLAIGITTGTPQEAFSPISTQWGSEDAQLLKARKLVEARPTDRMAIATLAVRSFEALEDPRDKGYRLNDGGSPDHHPRWKYVPVLTREDLEEVLRKGETLDPENGLYPALRAGAYLSVAALAPVGEQQQVTFNWQNGQPPQSLDISRRAYSGDALEKGLAALHEVRKKRYITDWAVIQTQQALKDLPKTDLADQALATRLMWGTLLPTLGAHRTTGNCALERAVNLMRDGKHEEAEEIFKDVQTMAEELKAGSAAMIEQAVAEGLLGDVGAYRYAAGVLTKNEKLQAQGTSDALAAAARLQSIKTSLQNSKTLASECSILDGSTVDGAGISNDAWGLMPPPEPMAAGRQAEYAMTDRLVVTLFAAASLVLAALAGLIAAYRRWRGHREVSIWIGWREIVKIVGLGCLPVVVYLVAANGTPFLGRSWSLGLNLYWLIGQWALVLLASATILALGVYRATKKRARVLGLTLPTWTGGKRLLWLSLLIGILSLASQTPLIGLSPLQSLDLFLAAIILLGPVLLLTSGTPTVQDHQKRKSGAMGGQMGGEIGIVGAGILFVVLSVGLPLERNSLVKSTLQAAGLAIFLVMGARYAYTRSRALLKRRNTEGPLVPRLASALIPSLVCMSLVLLTVVGPLLGLLERRHASHMFGGSSLVIGPIRTTQPAGQ